jgi:hypothetical protein
MRHRLTLKFKPANTGPQNRRKTVGGILRTLTKPAKGQKDIIFGLNLSTLSIFCYAAGAVCLFALLERRVFDGTWRAAALTLGCLWAWVFIQNCAILAPFHTGIYFRSVEAEQARVQELAGWLVAAVWLAAVIVRLYLHRRWKRTQSEANQPAPAGPA